MARARSTIIRWKATTDDWMRYKRLCCGSSCPSCKNGTIAAADLAENYNQLLRGLDSLQTPLRTGWSRSNYHLYVVVLCRKAATICRGISQNRILVRVFTIRFRCTFRQAYAYLGCTEGSLPETERQAKRTLSLPMYPQLKREQQERVVEVIHQFCETQTLGRNIA